MFYLLEKLIKVEKARAKEGGKKRKKERKKRLRQKEFILFAKCYVHFDAYIISILFVESHLIGDPEARCTLLGVFLSLYLRQYETDKTVHEKTHESYNFELPQFRNECGPVGQILSLSIHTCHVYVYITNC